MINISFGSFTAGAR